MDSHFLGFFVFLICIVSLPPVTPQYSYARESELRSIYLGSSYDRTCRPDASINLTVSLSLFSVLDLDINQEMFQFSGYFSFEWTDSRLDWSSNSTYSTIPAIYSEDDILWVPTIIVENSLSDVGILNDGITPIRVKNDGTIQWEIAKIFKTSCNVDVSYYPFDTQVCEVIITTWGYTDNEITITFDTDDDTVSTQYFSPNGEWDYAGYETASEASTRRGSSHTMKSFRLKWRRRPQFHILNTLIPVLLLGFLNGIVFRMPSDCGEKVGFVLTILLAYAVYLTMISSEIPTTSQNTCILSVFLIIVLGLSVMSVISTCVSLIFYFRDDALDPMSPSATAILRFVAKASCWRHLAKCCKGSSQIEASRTPVVRVQSQIGHHDNAGNEKDGELEEVLTWKEASEILDRASFIAYYSILSFVTIVCLLILIIAFATMTNSEY